MIKTVEVGGIRWTSRSPGVILLTGGKEMSTATLTSKGQITLPKEVREHLHLGAGDQVDFQIDEHGEVRVRPLTGSVEDLFGLLYRPGSPSRSVEEMDDAIARFVAADDQRIRRGEQG